jgi:hypothetical protein
MKRPFLALVALLLSLTSYGAEPCKTELALWGESDGLIAVFPGAIAHCDGGLLEVWSGRQPRKRLPLAGDDLKRFTNALSQLGRDLGERRRDARSGSECQHSFKLYFASRHLTVCRGSDDEALVQKASELIRWVYSRR